MKDESWIEDSGLYGTWTFTTSTMTDLGYYKGVGYVVMHVMPNPMAVQSCDSSTRQETTDRDDDRTILVPNNNTVQHCNEAENQACVRNGTDAEAYCVNTETTSIGWSDVTVFFYFGFQLRTGIIQKKYQNINTQDWVGPYNMILAPVQHPPPAAGPGSGPKHREVYVSRYVNNPWTEAQIQRPLQGNIFEFDPSLLEKYVGTIAINTTITEAQRNWNGGLPTTTKTSSSSAPLLGDERKKEQQQVRTNRRLGRSGSSSTQPEGFTDAMAYHTNPDDDEDEEVENDTSYASIDADPYEKYYRNCEHGNIRPILPRLQIEKIPTPNTSANTNSNPAATTTATSYSYNMQLEYSILSFPQQNGIHNDLYKLWPELQTKLGTTFPLWGPYCYENDPNRVYAIRFSYDSVIPDNTNNTMKKKKKNVTTAAPPPISSLWTGQKGCLPWLPCWGDARLPADPIPTHNEEYGGTCTGRGQYIIDPLGLSALLLYLLGVLLFISMICNCLLSNRLQERYHEQQSRQRLSHQEEEQHQEQEHEQLLPLSLSSAPSSQQQQEAPRNQTEPPPSSAFLIRQQQQQQQTRYDYLEDVAGSGSGNTGTGNNSEEGQRRDAGDRKNTVGGSNIKTNTRTLLEEPLLPDASHYFDAKESLTAGAGTPSRNNKDKHRAAVVVSTATAPPSVNSGTHTTTTETVLTATTATENSGSSMPLSK